ncbi:helix-turn-helix domain-containing protein [Methylobacterium sp. J-078]|uniref:helix-turn-helix domain-containing protein n=1 Tax=Methylobacterium sp. J-078 TaxID=2836657 RepID=UPI001FBABFFC|nr:helix-turn-helix domain-containing protein [Methylobacterium sp. J-078]MCJ2046107.1 helix-turn-helix domain-containing protein [Methylobacterium sp. J-078]
MTREQCRAARAWLDWPQQELAKRATVGLSTIRQFENNLRVPIANNLSAMRRAFEEAGISFIEAGITYCDPSPASEPAPDTDEDEDLLG